MDQKKNLFFFAKVSWAGKANKEYCLLPVSQQDVAESFWLLRRKKRKKMMEVAEVFLIALSTAALSRESKYQVSQPARRMQLQHHISMVLVQPSAWRERSSLDPSHNMLHCIATKYAAIQNSLHCCDENV